MQAWWGVKDNVARPDHKAAPRGMAREAGEDRKAMVDPRARKAQRQGEGGLDRAEGLVEIRRHLFRDREQSRRPQPRPCGIGDRVEIADHRFGDISGSKRPVGPRIGGKNPWRAGSCHAKFGLCHRAAADKCHPRG